MLTVEQVQVILKGLGYEPGPVDGVLGPKTKQALQRFQLDQKILVTGIIDTLTEQRLVLAAKEKGLDDKWPWWLWVAVVSGTALAGYGLYKLATYKKDEDEDALYQKAIAAWNVRPEFPLQDAFAQYKFQDPRRPVVNGRAPSPALMRDEQEQILAFRYFDDPVMRADRQQPRVETDYRGEYRDQSTRRDSEPRLPVTVVQSAPPMTMPVSAPPTGVDMVVHAEPTSEPPTLVRDLPPPPRRATLSEMLDLERDAEKRARSMASPKSDRYAVVLANERRRLVGERFGRR